MRDGHACRPLQDRWGNRSSGLAAASPCPQTAHSGVSRQPPTLFETPPPCPGEVSRPCAGTVKR
eukprot:1510052-Prymnesium_polylepis.1